MTEVSRTCYLFVVILGTVLVNSTVGTNQITVAQMNGSNYSSAVDKINPTLKNPTFDTFSAVGTISSLNFDSNNISNIAASIKVILSGDWILNVNKGNVSFFEADFVAAPAEGSASHIHELVNLVVKDAKPIQLASNGNASIVGTIDVKLNGINYWNDVKTTILISKGSTVTITLDDIDTEHHFMRQPIYGLVDRLMY